MASSPSVRRSTRSPRRRDPKLPPGLGFTPRTPKIAPQPRTPEPTPAGDRNNGTLPCLVYVAAYVVAVLGGLVGWHAREHGVFNLLQASLALFAAINAWICICEIALLTGWSRVQEQFKAFRVTHGEWTLPPVFLFQRVTLAEVFSVQYWTIMWSTYCALDPAYADTTSFGFCVDVGNGVTTLLPTIIFAAGMTAQSALLPAKWLGMVGLISFYQELYGTCLYFFQYCFNRKYAHVPTALSLGVVVPANGIWMAFPLLGMWASARLILDGNYSIFLGGYAFH